MENNVDQKEISLKDIILRIWKGKWIVVAFTAAALIIGLLYTFVFLEPIYISKAVLSAKPDEKLNITIDTYLQQAQSIEFFDMAIKNENLLTNSGDAVSTEDLVSMVSIEKVSDNSFAINVRNTDPNLSAKIANSLSKEFTTFITERIRENGEKDAVALREQLVNKEQGLKKKAKALSDFLQKYDDIEQQKGQIDALSSQLSSYLTSLNDSEKDIKTYEIMLADLYERADTVGLEVTKTDLSISLSEGSAGIINDVNNDELDSALLGMQIEETEESLIKEKANKESLTEFIDEIQNQINEKQLDYLSVEYIYNGIFNEYDLAKQSYQESWQLQNDALSKSMSNVGETHTAIVLEASAPSEPSEPNKLKNMVIALAIGLILGVVIVLFRAWLTDGRNKTMKSQSTN